MKRWKLAVAGISFLAVAPMAIAVIPPKESASGGTKASGTDGAKGKNSKEKKESMDQPLTYNRLTREEQRILLYKGTDRPFSGKYTNAKQDGTYLCKRCNAPLYDSKHKFPSNCGWPSFDDEIEGAVTRKLETDGTGRIEIVCTCCGGHLGHIFAGEGYTFKNVRHCVNSTSMNFIPRGKELPKVIKLDPSGKEKPLDGDTLKDGEKSEDESDSEVGIGSKGDAGSGKAGKGKDGQGSSK